MLYSLLADTVFLVHFLFIIFATFGAALLLRWPILVYLHLPALLWAIAITSFGWICPLTPLENYFLDAAGSTTFEGGFIAYYLEPVIYPAGLTRTIQIGLAGALAVYNAVVYSYLIYRHRRQSAGFD